MEVIQGTISGDGETFQRRKTASAGRLQLLEPLFDDRLGLWKRTLVGHALSTAATNKQYGDDGQMCGRPSKAHPNYVWPWKRSPSRERLQLFAINPAVLAIGGFHSVPVRSNDQDHDFRARFQRLDVGCAVERGGLQLASRSLYHPFRLMTQILETLVQGLS